MLQIVQRMHAAVFVFTTPEVLKLQLKVTVAHSKVLLVAQRITGTRSLHQRLRASQRRVAASSAK
jgi:hypothetical protein